MEEIHDKSGKYRNFWYIGSDGNILAKLDLEQEGVVDYKLNLRSIKTVYNNYGNSLFILIMLTLLFVICNSVFYRKNKS